MLRPVKLTAVLALAAGLIVPATSSADVPGIECSGDPNTVQHLDGQSFGTGRYVLPATESPTVLVAMAHGYGHTSASWENHMKRTAAEGAIAFAMDYRGSWVDADGENRGWFVQEGADDTIAVAQMFLSVCPTLDTVIIYGVSMGGNASGLAVAAGATRPNGDPLFDHWVAGEPAANVLETYHEASALAPANAFAANAAADIEAEHGGTFLEQTESYLNGTVVLRAADIAASGLKSAAIVHAFDDGLVPYDQGRELATVLRLNGVPTDFYNVLRRETDGTDDGSDQTTLEDYALGHDDPEPLAGHGSESSDTNIVIQTGLDLVFALIGGSAGADGSEYLVDGELGTVALL